jgi:hypothetical protein
MQKLNLYFFDNIDINSTRFATRSLLLLNKSFVTSSGKLTIYILKIILVL